jgi:hypothetical protein
MKGQTVVLVVLAVRSMTRELTAAGDARPSLSVIDRFLSDMGFPIPPATRRVSPRAWSVPVDVVQLAHIKICKQNHANIKYFLLSNFLMNSTGVGTSTVELMYTLLHYYHAVNTEPYFARPCLAKFIVLDR